MNRRKRILILGSTGSIGIQALEIILANPEYFKIVGLAASGNNSKIFLAQREVTGITNTAITQPMAAKKIGDVKFTGPNACSRLIENTEADLILNALVGAFGLEPTLVALATGAQLALANKESLITGGSLVTNYAKPGQIIPVDSEHSAIAQCLLHSGPIKEVSKIVLTASGGPFLKYSSNKLALVTPMQAMRHPTWFMGVMNTINSATLVNKGLELIETHLLFKTDSDKIEVLIHPQSVVHSIINFTDNSSIAQMYLPDMKLPISLALGAPNRISSSNNEFPSFNQAHNLEFMPVNNSLFPAVEIARYALYKGGCIPAIYNKVNEIAVKAFLSEQISFTSIVKIINDVLNFADQWNLEPTELSNILDAQKWAENLTKIILKKHTYRIC